MNAAYVVIGLLYGDGDFYKTMDVSTRCGQDSDCNPATAAGILGVIKGYSGIPQYWKPGLEKIEKLDFPYTTISLEQVYDLSMKHALQLIEKNEGKVTGTEIRIKVQKPETVQWEESFEGMFPKERRLYNKDIEGGAMEHAFNGNGIVCMGAVKRIAGEEKDYVALLDVYLDEKKVEQVKMPFDYIVRKYDIWHRYMLTEEAHKLRIEWVNPRPDFRITMKDVVIYSERASKINLPEEK